MSEPRGAILTGLLDFLATYKTAPLHIVETGCLRSEAEEYRMGDGHSTLYLARWAKEHGSVFRSLELDLRAIETAKIALNREGLGGSVEFTQGDSVETLIQWHWIKEPIDFAYLDSSPSPVLNLAEFCIVLPLLRKPAMIVIDDCFGLPKDETKGRLTLEYVSQRAMTPIHHLDRMAMMLFGEGSIHEIPGSLIPQ